VSLDGVKMTVGNDSQWHALATLDDVAPGQMIAREVGDIRLALYNVGGEIFATDNVCTHAYALLRAIPSRSTFEPIRFAWSKAGLKCKSHAE
jgi:nitrite reductase/ring-hydroxylating ferredoxin subunit